jgi:predicted transposase YbfD/YdcC
MARRAKKLQELAKIMEGHVINEFEDINVTVLSELNKEAEEVDDPRNIPYTWHKLSEIILIVLFAVMANANEWSEIETFGKSKEKWLKTFLKLENGIPTDDTFRIVLSQLDVQSVYRIIIGFLIKKLSEIVTTFGTETLESEKEILSCDGKVSRSSKRNETDIEGSKALNTLSAYSSEWGMCIDQEFIEEKSNEIPAMPILLERLDLRDTIVTWDALNTQKDTVEAVIEGKGDYVAALKGNHGNIYNDVKDYFDDETIKEIKNEEKVKKHKKTVDKEHSAIITREYYLGTDIDWLYGKEEWKGLKAIGVEIKKIEKNGKVGEPMYEKRYFISSIIEIDDFARAVRGHWGVENGLHWHLDYTFNDDKNTTKRGNGAEGLQIFKKIVLGLLKIVQILYPPRTSIKKIRYKLSLDYENEIEKIFTALNPDNIKNVLAK